MHYYYIFKKSSNSFENTIQFYANQIESNKDKKKTEIQKPRKKKTKCKTRVYIICIFIEYSIYK